MVTQAKPQCASWCVLPLLSRGTLSSNTWYTGPYRQGVGSIQFFEQYMEQVFGFSRQLFHSWDTGPKGRKEIVFVLPELASHFIHHWHLFCFPAHFCQWVDIRWWCMLYRLPPHGPYALDFTWIYGWLQVFHGIINQLLHGYFPQVLDRSLHGGPLAWVACNVFLEEISVVHSWQELLPMPKHLCPSYNSLVYTPYLDRDPSFLASLPAS